MIELQLLQIYHLKEISFSAEIFLSCSILQLTFFAIGTTYQRKHGYVLLNQQVYGIGALIIGLTILLLINENYLITSLMSSNNFLANDYLSLVAKLTICFSSFLFLLIVNVLLNEGELSHNNFEYVILVTISILGLMLLSSSNDLITAYLSIELQSVAFYIMAAFKKNSTYSIESGLKYFIVGSLSSSFFLFGSSLIYGCVGSLSFDDFEMFLSLLAITAADSELSSTIVLAESIPDFVFNKKIMTEVMSQYNFLERTTLYDWTNAHNYGPDNQTIDTVKEMKLPYQYFPNTFFEFSKADSIFSAVSSERAPLFSSSFNNKEFSVFLHENASYFSHLSPSYNFELSNFPGINLDLLHVGFLFLCISLLIKLAIAPFHYWSLDVYEGSPNATTFFFAVIPKIGIFVLFSRICYISFHNLFSSEYQFYFFLFGVLSVFVGSVGGLEQRKIKSLLAYSSISHTGYLLLSLSTNTLEGVQLMLYYLIIFMVAGLCFWSIFLIVKRKQNFYFEKHNKELGDFVLLKNSNPLLCFIFAITLFSIAGIPPVVGFLAKVGIFLTIIQSSAYLVALISVLLSVISTFYYIRFIKVLYFENVLVGNLYIAIETKKASLIAIIALMLIILCMDPSLLYLIFFKAGLLLT